MWLIGMMGSGKSTVGMLAAERVGVSFYDTDVMVEERAGASIAAIWSDLGEVGFRRMESDAVRAVPPEGAIAAAGGGAVLDPGNRRIISGSREVVWLSCDVTTLTRRLEDADDRPLLSGSPAITLDKLLTERLPLYAAVATRVVDTSKMTVEQVVNEVLETWRS